MRIGYVVKRYPRFSETFIVNEILAHESAGWEVEIFALRPPTDTHFQDMLARVRGGVTYVTPDRPRAGEVWSALGRALELGPSPSALETLSKAAVRDGHQAMRLAALARDHEIRHLHAHFASTQAEVTALAAPLAGVPYTVTAHAKDIFHDDVDRVTLQRRFETAARVITVSEFNVRYLRRRAPRARVTRIYNGIDLDEFSFQPAQKREPVIVAAGRLVEKKGFEVLVEACEVMRDQGRVFRCAIVGAGAGESELRRKIDRHRLGGLVSLCGPRPRGELKRMIQAAALFVAPCVEARDGDRDGVPTVLVEAMALGTPCVATPVTGIPELIEDGVSGCLVPQRDPIALARAMAGLLDDESRRTSIAARARKHIEGDFDLSKNAAVLRSVFRAARSRDARGENAA